MISSDEIFMEEREAEYNNDDEMHHQQLSDEEYYIAPIDITSLQPSLATSEQIANDIIMAVREGRISPIEFAVKKKCIVEAFELAFKDPEVKKMALEEVELYGKNGAMLFGATIKVTTTTKYDYSKDSKWKELSDSIAPVIEQLKQQEDKIKVACKNNASLVDSDTGELIASIVPATISDTVAVSFKKK